MGSGASLVSYVEWIGNVTSNRQLYNIIPRIIRNNGDIPSFSEIISSNLDILLVVLSLFITLRILLPSTMIYNGFSFWVLIITFLLVPTLLSITLFLIRQNVPDGKGEEGVIMPGISFALASLSLLFLAYIAWPLTGIFGFETGILYVILWLFLFLPLMLGLTILSKSIAPIMVLLLGPGVIPHLANQSFFEFCS
jgi:hypothetical protein